MTRIGRIPSLAAAAAIPLTAANGKPTVTGAAKASLVGTGDTAGQGVNGFGAEWYVLSAAGTQVSGPASSSSGGYYPR